jgi:rhomboid family GlyGly-CTERM serine protease
VYSIEHKLDRWDERPVLSLFMAAVAAVLFVVPRASGMLSYERSLAHELWRAVTCHWVHWNAEHLLWCVGTFVVLGVLCERQDRRRFVACVAGSALVIPLVLWFVQPELLIYGGLSGLDSALFVLLAVTLIREKTRSREWIWTAAFSVALLAFIAKTAFEFTTHTPVFLTDTTGMTPVPLAHLAGAVIGITAGLIGVKGPQVAGGAVKR